MSFNESSIRTPLTMRCLLWNLQWATPRGPRGRQIAAIIAGAAPDLLCLTEAVEAMVPHAHRIASDPDYGYPIVGGRRKVLMGSHSGWRQVSDHADRRFPAGRIISGISNGIRCIGVCIPWSAAHVSTGRRDRARWEDHRSFLRALRAVLVEAAAAGPVLLMGDFNQSIPRRRQPQAVYDLLLEVLHAANMTIATAGLSGHGGASLIDHVAVTPELSVRDIQILPRISAAGDVLSDHDGVVFGVEG